MIRLAMQRGAMGSYDHVETDVLAGKALLWIAWGGPAGVVAAMVTQIAGPDDRKVCTIMALGGVGRGLWMCFRGEVEAYARAEGCVAMRVCGRKGWARVLKDYHLARVVLEKRL